jgi:CheY-like chemotaxis protein
MRTLIVDDKEENLYMLETLLKGSGYGVATARNGVEALVTLRKDSIDLIISDILMPEMDGFQFCRECKTDTALRRIPFVFYTATYTDKKDEEFALGLGAEKFIAKPMDPGDFMKIIDGVLKDYKEGRFTPSEVPVEKEEVYLKGYNERLVKKLEEKMLDLEEVNRMLRKEIEERRMVEEENLKAKDRIIEEMKHHEEYVFDVADRLRNPLQRLMGFLELFDTEDLTAEQKKFLEDIRKSVQDLEKGIKKLT